LASDDLHPCYMYTNTHPDTHFTLHVHVSVFSIEQQTAQIVWPSKCNQINKINYEQT
jgi:hypothetical protein